MRNNRRATTSDDLSQASEHSITATATRYGHTFALYVPSRMIPPHEQDDVMEFEIARASDPQKKFILYATHSPEYGRAYLDLYHPGARHREQFVVITVRKHSLQEFVSAYNRGKPDGLENTELCRGEQRLDLKVDGITELPLRDVRFDTYQGQVVLHGKIGDEENNRVKIASGFGPFDFRLEDLSVVVSLKSDGSDVVLGYRRNRNDPRIRRRLVQTSRREQPEILVHEINFEQREIVMEKMISPEEGAATIQICFNEDARYRAWKYWTLAASHEERKQHQGDIGEAVVCALLEKSGYEIVERHTVQSKFFQPKHSCRALGRDILVVKSGEYYVAEVKHWISYKELAIKAAEKELLEFAVSTERDELEKRLQSKIKGALAIQLEWSYALSEAAFRWVCIDLSGPARRMVDKSSSARIPCECFH